MKETFNDFADLSKKDGILITKLGLGIESLTYSIEGDSDYKATKLRIEDHKYHFDLLSPMSGVSSIISNQFGEYNVENTLAAFAMAEQYGLSSELITEAISTFSGVQRRFNVFKYESKIIVDDYAHHPSEIEVVYKASKELYAGLKVGVVFQPHLYSRTRDFEAEFAKVLSKFNSVALLDIYPARELPIEGVTSENLLNLIENSKKQLLIKGDIKSYVQNCDNDVILMLGAGDIGVEINKLKVNNG